MKLYLPCAILAALLLSACGQTGDLYLPDNPPTEVRKREEQQRKREQDKQAQPAAAPQQEPVQEPGQDK